MADLKGSTASVVTVISDTTRFLVSDGGQDAVATGSQIGPYMGNKIRKVSTATQALTVAGTTKVTGSDIAIPSTGLKVGVVLRWRLTLTKTAAGVANRSFLVKIGTAGTTADANVQAFTSTNASTAAVDQAVVEIVCIVTAIGSGTTATMEGSLKLEHNLASTGFAPTNVQVVAPASTVTGFDSTVANLIATLAVTTGTSEAITVRQVIAEALNL